MRITRIPVILVLAFGLMVHSAGVSQASPMGTVFTYQGRLIDSNSTADGPYDFQFKLYDGAGGYELLGGFWPGGPLCFVQFDDFARFADYWLTADLIADLDDDKDLDFADLQSLADYWLSSCPYAWPLK